MSTKTTRSNHSKYKVYFTVAVGVEILASMVTVMGNLTSTSSHVVFVQVEGPAVSALRVDLRM